MLVNPVRLKEEGNGTGCRDRLADVHILMPWFAEDDSLSGIKIVSRDEEFTGEFFEIVAETFVMKGFTEVGLQGLQRKNTCRELFLEEVWQITQTNLPVAFTIVLEDPKQAEWQPGQRVSRRPQSTR